MATCSIRSRKWYTCGTVNEMKHASTHHKKYTHTHRESYRKYTKHQKGDINYNTIQYFIFEKVCISAHLYYGNNRVGEFSQSKSMEKYIYLVKIIIMY